MHGEKMQRPPRWPSVIQCVRKAGLVLFMTATGLLPGCAPAAFEIHCPPLVAYDNATQQTATEELKNSSSQVLIRFANDYGRLRAQCRALGKPNT